MQAACVAMQLRGHKHISKQVLVEGEASGMCVRAVLGGKPLGFRMQVRPHVCTAFPHCTAGPNDDGRALGACPGMSGSVRCRIGAFGFLLVTPASAANGKPPATHAVSSSTRSCTHQWKMMLKQHSWTIARFGFEHVCMIEIVCSLRRLIPHAPGPSLPQLYAPVDANPVNAFHRSLFLFISPEVGLSMRGMRLQRAFPGHNSSANKLGSQPPTGSLK